MPVLTGMSAAFPSFDSAPSRAPACAALFSRRPRRSQIVISGDARASRRGHAGRWHPNHAAASCLGPRVLLALLRTLPLDAAQQVRTRALEVWVAELRRRRLARDFAEAVHVQLAHEGLHVGVLEVARQNLRRELVDVVNHDHLSVRREAAVLRVALRVENREGLAEEGAHMRPFAVVQLGLYVARVRALHLSFQSEKC
eukprot:scaffold79_cov259-Pinguiococcus_pyrenoidosus.AAC.34